MLTGSGYRILDANANRAREALRVLEDYARFALDDDGLSGELKAIRHELARLTGPYLPDAILHRDTAGDVGTDNKTVAEFRRDDLGSVVVAAGKRLGEALRVLEEVLKSAGQVEPTPSSARSSADDVPVMAPAAGVEKLRYRFYILEQAIVRTLRPATRFGDVRLYVLITESLCRRPWLETAEQAILGGADCLQLREKQLDSGEFLRRARLLGDLCRRHGVLFIVNDRPDIAVLAGADGVHVGQEDLPAIEARKIVGHGKIVGVSTHRIEHARQAVLDGADYIGVGPVFPSSTKPRDILPGLDYARQVAGEIRIPAVAIAGITHENVGEVAATGVRAVAVTAAVVGQEDAQAVARELKRRLVGQTFLSVAPEPPPAPVGQTLLSVAPEPRTAPVGQTFLSVPSIPTAPSGSPSAEELRKRRRQLPNWTLTGSMYFITFRLRATEFTPSERTLVLNHIRSGDALYYQLLACVIMPDHVHLLIRPKDGLGLSRITKGIKGASARLINEHRKTVGRIWQDESFDRIVRDAAEFDEKLVYMYNNPVKRALVANADDYEWWFVNLGSQG